MDVISRKQRFAWLAVTTLAMSSGALAEVRREPERHLSAHQHFDERFSHNHAYFDRGYVVRAAPHDGYAIVRGRDNFWYSRGEWYRHSGARWVVVGAPIGAFVPILPPFYTTVWFGGLPYYYANETYYTWDGGQREYRVVDPPNQN